MSLLNSILGLGTEASPEGLADELHGFLMEGETVHVGYKLVRDFLAFTDRRIIIVDRQGLTGKKTAYVSLPYKSIAWFSVETAGSFDLDTDIVICAKGGTAPFRLHCSRDTNIKKIQAALAWGVFGG